MLCMLSLFWKVNLLEIEFKSDGVFLELAGLLHGISFRLWPREIPWSSPASPLKTPSVLPFLLGLTQSVCDKAVCRMLSYAGSANDTANTMVIKSTFRYSYCTSTILNCPVQWGPRGPELLGQRSYGAHEGGTGQD